ncbi:hypothetical protein I546_6056 [Mycobacterium kansasii 732]|uniref:Uncharacterized protein n=1 Tax=Mycobacterium kansasii TaxID=1768 RepID=A0A1V3XS92_MYCKA|nr:hypothetical protein I546_6056 [Mycobacterium kansasii 732]OOK82065.1 hypothetical protein BZL30_0689 [Mycobacterium kansasii]
MVSSMTARAVCHAAAAVSDTDTTDTADTADTAALERLAQRRLITSAARVSGAPGCLRRALWATNSLRP